MSEIDNLKGEFEDLLFDVHRSIRYHDKRRGFLEGFQKVKDIATVIVGSAIVFNAAGSTFLTITAIIVLILSAIDLAASVGAKVRIHSDLRRRFIELEQEMIRINKPTIERINEWKQERLIIEADEPPVQMVLDAICYNEQLYADGYDNSHLRKIENYQRWFAQIIDISPEKTMNNTSPSIEIPQNSQPSQLPVINESMKINLEEDKS